MNLYPNKMKSPYIHQKSVHNGHSAKEVVPILMRLFTPRSVVDLGCGLGDWLHEFTVNGVENILGIDGNWVEKQNLYINESHFLEKDLTTKLHLKQKFDLAMSLEVAEHLPEKAADSFVQTLTSLSDTIVFSAAIPGQGGQNHLNEQWHDYWVAKFEKHGFYCHDLIRPLIWENDNVEWWYKQNCFVFTQVPTTSHYFTNAIHPNLLNDKLRHIQHIYEGKMGVKASFTIFRNALLDVIKRWIKL